MDSAAEERKTSLEKLKGAHKDADDFDAVDEDSPDERDKEDELDEDVKDEHKLDDERNIEPNSKECEERFRVSADLAEAELKYLGQLDDEAEELDQELEETLADDLPDAKEREVDEDELDMKAYDDVDELDFKADGGEDGLDFKGDGDEDELDFKGDGDEDEDGLDFKEDGDDYEPHLDDDEPHLDEYDPHLDDDDAHLDDDDDAHLDDDDDAHLDDDDPHLDEDDAHLDAADEDEDDNIADCEGKNVDDSEPDLKEPEEQDELDFKAEEDQDALDVNDEDDLQELEDEASEHLLDGTEDAAAEPSLWTEWDRINFMGDETLQILEDAIARKGALQLIQGVLDALQQHGTMEAWFDILTRNAGEAVARMTEFLSPDLPHIVSAKAASALMIFTSVDAEMWNRQGIVLCQVAAEHMCSGIEKAYHVLEVEKENRIAEDVEAAEHNLTTWLSLLYSICVAACFPKEITSDDEQTWRERIQSAIDVATVELVCQAITSGSEEVFHAAVKCLVGMSNVQMSVGMENPVIEVVDRNEDARHDIGEGLLHLYNDVASVDHLNDDMHTDARMLYQFFQDVLDDESTASMWRMNDMKTLVDILVRALQDLPADDLNRGQAVAVLRGVLRTSSWIESGHRRSDIMDELEAVMALHEDRMVPEEVGQVAEETLRESQHVLYPEE